MKRIYTVPEISVVKVLTTALMEASPSSLRIGGVAETEGSDGVVLSRGHGGVWDDDEY